MSEPDHERDFLAALQAVGLKPKTDAEVTARVEAVSLDHPASTTEAPAPGTVTLQNLWRHPDAHPVVLDLLLLSKYGPDWLEWEPETLQALIPEDFKTPSISDLNLSKLHACKTLHMVDSFWQRWEIFLACTMPFNSEFPDFDTLQVPTVAQCLVACDVAARIRTDAEWSTEVRAFVATVYKHDGIFMPLPPANFVELEVPEEIPVQEVATRWKEVRASGHAPSGQTPVDEQLRRLLVANGYLEESRTRLQQQLRFTHA